ncbi:hypothetical protein [Saccharothrix stipae]
MPTFEQLVPTVVEAIPEASRAGHRGYLGRFVAVQGSRRLDEVDVKDVVGFLTLVRETAEVRVSRSVRRRFRASVRCSVTLAPVRSDHA